MVFLPCIYPSVGWICTFTNFNCQTEPRIVTIATMTRHWFTCSRSVHGKRTWVSHLHMLQVLMQIKTTFLIFISNAHQNYMVQLQHIWLSFSLLYVASSLEVAPPSHDHKIHHSCVNKFHTSWKIFVSFLGYDRSLRGEKKSLSIHYPNYLPIY